MTSKEPVLISPDWPKPYLVFWDKHVIRRTGYVEIQVDGQWVMVKDIGDTRSEWVPVTIDLTPYKGKQMIVRFVSEIGYYQQSTWFVQDVKVIPDFKP